MANFAPPSLSNSQQLLLDHSDSCSALSELLGSDSSVLADLKQLDEDLLRLPELSNFGRTVSDSNQDDYAVAMLMDSDKIIPLPASSSDFSGTLQPASSTVAKTEASAADKTSLTATRPSVSKTIKKSKASNKTANHPKSGSKNKNKNKSNKAESKHSPVDTTKTGSSARVHSNAARSEVGAVFDAPENDVPSAIRLTVDGSWTSGQQIEVVLPGKLEQPVRATLPDQLPAPGKMVQVELPDATTLYRVELRGHKIQWVPRKKLLTVLRNRKSATACRDNITHLKAELNRLTRELSAR